MPEAHLSADIQEPAPLRGLERRAGHAEARRRPPHQRRVADGLRRRHQEQPPRIVGQLVEPALEALLDPAGQRQQLRQAEPAGHLRRRQAARQLEQRERIAARLGDDPVPDAFVEPARDDRRQQRAGVVVAEPFQLQLGQPDQLALVARVAHGEHDRHRLRQQASRDEPENLSRRGVEPLRVVDEAEQRPFLGDVGQQAERSQRDQEAGGVAGLEAEGHSQGDLLRLGQRVEPPEHRSAEPVQPGERQLHLGLDARDLRDPEARGLAGAVAQ